MSDQGATGMTEGGGGADEAMSVDSDSGIASPGSTASHVSSHASETGSTSTLVGSTGQSSHSVHAPGHQQSSHGYGSQHNISSDHSQHGHGQHPGQTNPHPGLNISPGSTDSAIFSGTTHQSGQTTSTNLPTETVNTAQRTEQWVEESFQVFVKNLDGKTHTIEVKADEEVTKFRQKVCQKLGIPAEQQRLVLQEGRTLEDGRKLRDYSGFKKHCNIYCQGRLRGGQRY